MATLKEIFDYDQISDFLNGGLNKFTNPVHLRVQGERIKNLNTFMIAEEFQRRGYFVVWDRKSRIDVPGLKPRLTFKFSHLRRSGQEELVLLGDKQRFKEALRQENISVPAGITLSVHDKEKGRRHVAAGTSAHVIKPACGHKGKGVTVGVCNEAQFDYAWDLAVAENRDDGDILIEEQFSEGVEARFLVVGGKCISVCRRIPPIVVADGRQTVEALIEEKNAEKRMSPGQVIRQIKLDQHRIELIREQGYALDDIPERGRHVLIDYKAGASTGADTLEISDRIHPDYLRIAEQVARVARTVPVLGVDIISRDFAKPPVASGYVVLEANIAPGLSGHCYPSYGKPKDVITPIVDYALSLASPRRELKMPSCRMTETPLAPDDPAGFDTFYQRWLEKETGSVTPGARARGLHGLARAVYDYNREGRSLVFFERQAVAMDDKESVSWSRENQGELMDKPFTITFCGDTSLGYYYLDKSKSKYAEAYERLQKDPMSFFAGVRSVLEGSDEIIVNLETVLSHAPGQPIDGKEYPGCDDPDVTLRVLKELGVTAVTLANNHTMDFGPDKLLAMIELLQEHGIAVIGAGRNLEEARKPYHIAARTPGGIRNVYVFNGMRSSRRYTEYGFFASKDRPGIASTNLKAMSREIEKIKAIDPQSVVVVCPHWQGIDYQDTGEKHQEWCRAIIAAGADHVIAHGSHKADRVEAYQGGEILYSIGNFVFNSPGRYRSRGADPYGLVPRLMLDGETANGEIDVTKIMTDNKASNFRVEPVDPPGKPASLDRDYARQKKNTYASDRPFSTYLHLEQELESLGFSTRRTAGILEASRGGEACSFLETETSFTSLVAYRILKDKARARAFLDQAGIQVARGEAFDIGDRKGARKLVQSLGRAVIKPVDGNKGKGVAVDIGLDEFDEAWKSAVKTTRKQVLVEEYFSGGQEARYLVVDGQCVAVSMRIPPRVEGDGKSTIAELIEQENAARQKNPNLIKRPLKVDASRLAGLKQRGHELSSVLAPGETVIIDTKANLSTGANSVDITDEVHPSMRRVAEEVALAIPGLDIVGIDILARDHAAPAEAGSYIIVEANTRPGIGGHLYPTYGEPRNVARIIAESVARKMGAR